MRRALALLALAAAGVAVWVSPGSARSEYRIPCKPNSKIGVETFGRTRVVLYCGSARATVRAGGKTYRFTNGMCFRLPNQLLVGIGRLTSNATPRFRAFTLATAATKAGKFHNAVIRYQLPGRESQSLQNTLVLRKKRLGGTFSGLFTPGGRVSGSFTCK